ncbi:MAG: hypothetical protein IPL01_01145 [Acidobacteria bacterium]|nr:hypothetical protein [Acidobacteriota bacterium]MBK8312696.1 hypothetical protein [Acidobacteriota bacterium]MBK9706820.1 hypothetical protein [Acidobacteriota bacterium]
MHDTDKIRQMLIDRGIWDSKDRRDPLTDREAVELVYNWMRDQVAPNVIIIPGETPNSSIIQIYLKRKVGGVVFPYILDSGNTMENALCFAALTLTDFLRSHPECLREQQENRSRTTA